MTSPQIKRLIIALLATLSLSGAAVAAAGPYHRHGGHRPDDGPVGADLRPDGGSRTGHPSPRLARPAHADPQPVGMVLGHVGVAVTVIGITFSQNYSVERDVRMRPGDSIDIHRYHFVFNGVRNIVGPNWTGGEGIIAVTRNGRPEATLYAEKRFYTASRMMMTEAAISGGLTRDLYAALGKS